MLRLVRNLTFDRGFSIGIGDACGTVRVFRGDRYRDEIGQAPAAYIDRILQSQKRPIDQTVSVRGGGFAKPDRAQEPPAFEAKGNAQPVS